MKRNSDELSEFFETVAPPNLPGNVSAKRWRLWNSETEY